GSLEGGPWFGAAAFDPSRPCWDGFPALRFVRPARVERGRPSLPARPNAARIVQRPGERARWTALVRRALGEIDRGTLDKIVLARAIDVEADGEIDPAALLR